MLEFITITGPAHWASYFFNDDASGLSDEDAAQADAWLARQGAGFIVGIADDENGEPGEAYFTNRMALFAPELGCTGGDVLDYIFQPATA